MKKTKPSAKKGGKKMPPFMSEKMMEKEGKANAPKKVKGKGEDDMPKGGGKGKKKSTKGKRTRNMGRS